MEKAIIRVFRVIRGKKGTGYYAKLSGRRQPKRKTSAGGWDHAAEVSRKPKLEIPRTKFREPILKGRIWDLVLGSWDFPRGVTSLP